MMPINNYFALPLVVKKQRSPVKVPFSFLKAPFSFLKAPFSFLNVPFSNRFLTERAPSQQKDVTVLFGRIFKRSIQTYRGLPRSFKCFTTLLETLVTYAHPEILPNMHEVVTTAEKSTLTGRHVGHFKGTVQIPGKYRANTFSVAAP